MIQNKILYNTAQEHASLVYVDIYHTGRFQLLLLSFHSKFFVLFYNKLFISSIFLGRGNNMMDVTFYLNDTKLH